MSLMTQLLSRSSHDLAIESFLQEMFLYITADLKSFRLVSKEWNNFIKLKMWGNKRTKESLHKILINGWKTQRSVRDVDISHIFPLIRKWNYIKRIACDDEILLLAGEDSDVKRLHIVNLQTLQNGATLDLDKQKDSVNEIRFSIGPTYFCTILTRDKWLNVWSKSGSIIDNIVIDEEPGYLRVVKAVKSMIFVVEANRNADNRVMIFKLVTTLDDSVKLVKLNQVTIDYVTHGVTRTVESDGVGLFLTGHDKVVCIWEITKNVPIKTISTGFVVDMVLKDDLLFTVGSAQNQGVHIWDIKSGSLVKSFLHESDEHTGLDKITLGVHQILLEGFKAYLLLMNLDDSFEIITCSKRKRHEVSCLMRAMGKSKLVMILPNSTQSRSDPNSTDYDATSILLCDYWSNL